MSSFGKAFISTYGLFVGGNYISNFLLHPTEKLDYGFLNKYIGRPVGNNWWGTRTEHVVTIAAPLAFTEVLFGKLLAKYVKVPAITWKATPGWAVAHAVSFTCVGIYGYLAWQCCANPNVTNPKKFLTDHIDPIVSGSYTMAGTPAMLTAFGPISAKVFPLGYIATMFPVAVAFVGVKGFGTSDWCKKGLTPYERYLNGLGPNPLAKSSDDSVALTSDKVEAAKE